MTEEAAPLGKDDFPEIARFRYLYRGIVGCEKPIQLEDPKTGMHRSLSFTQAANPNHPDFPLLWEAYAQKKRELDAIAIIPQKGPKHG